MSVLPGGDGRIGSRGTGTVFAGSELPKSGMTGISRGIRPIDVARFGGKVWARSGKTQNTQFVVSRLTVTHRNTDLVLMMRKILHTAKQ